MEEKEWEWEERDDRGNIGQRHGDEKVEEKNQRGRVGQVFPSQPHGQFLSRADTNILNVQ